jgi:hypothetical protein
LSRLSSKFDAHDDPYVAEFLDCSSSDNENNLSPDRQTAETNQDASEDNNNQSEAGFRSSEYQMSIDKR